jgi:hypothetical protein
MYLVSVAPDQISESEDNHNQLIRTSFSWAEIGDCDSGNDLFDNNFIDEKDGVIVGEVSLTEDRLNRLEHAIQVLRDTKADDITFTTPNQLRPTASGVPIGVGVNLFRYENDITFREL